MKEALLGDLCEITVGGTPARADASLWGEGEPWLSIADMNQGLLITHTKEQISPAAARSGKQVKPGTVLLSFKLSIGKVARAGMPLYTNEAIAALPIRESARLDESYLLRALQARDLTGGANRAAMGATLNKAKLASVLVPLPTLKEQRRIAAILDQADALRTKRRQALAHLDDLTQSIFHDMFGEVDWPSSTLDEVSLVVGEYGANVSSIEETPGRPRYVRITDIDDRGSLGSDRRSPGGDPEKWERYRLVEGDILFARSGATVGKTFRYRKGDGDCVFAGYLIRYRPDPSMIHPDYLFSVTKSAKYNAWVAARQNVVAQPNISAKKYGRELQIPLPPLPLQREFATRTEHVHRQRAAVERALTADGELFASLQSRAFSGGL